MIFNIGNSEKKIAESIIEILNESKSNENYFNKKKS